jgi:hypothetical protein
MALEAPKKFIQEFKDNENKVVARWHYDRDKFPHGPILCENFDLPRKEKKKKKKGYE